MIDFWGFKTILYQRKRNTNEYTELGEIRISDGCLYADEVEFELPNSWHAGITPITDELRGLSYWKHSNKIVNTHLKYRPMREEVSIDAVVFTKLNWWNHLLIHIQLGKTLWQKQPINSLGLLLAFVGALIGLYRDFFVYPLEFEKSTPIEKFQTENFEDVLEHKKSSQEGKIIDSVQPPAISKEMEVINNPDVNP